MATYYVGAGGNDANAGTSWAQRKLTLNGAEGVPVHVHVDLYNETATMEQHWVLIIGKNGSDYIINDPWTGKQGSFREAYGDPARWIFRIASWRS